MRVEKAVGKVGSLGPDELLALEGSQMGCNFPFTALIAAIKQQTTETHNLIACGRKQNA